MSIINQMLQDLEKRRASGAERGALPNQVRVLPRDESRRLPRWLIGMAAAGAVVAALIWQFNLRTPPSPPPAPVAQAPRDAPAPALPPAPGSPASRLALELENVPPMPARDAAPSPLTTPAVVASSPAVKTQSGKIKAEVERPAPSPAETRIAAVAPAVRQAEVAPVKPAAAPPRVAEAAPENKVQAAPGNAQIEKRAQAQTPQQLAENEYREAANFLNQGRLTDAQEGFRRALQNNPAHAGARQALFGLLVDAKKNGDAEQLLQEGLRLNPNQPGFAMELASLQYERGDVGAAIETMQKAAPAAQASPDYLARLAGLLQRQSRHKEAVENYQAALRLAPGSGVWLMGMGISLQALNRNTEAQDAFRRARSSNTLSPDLQAFVDQRMKQLQ